MHDYKEHTEPEVRQEEARKVAAILARYFFEHHDTLVARFGGWDGVVAVPSSHHTRPPALQCAVEANFPGSLGEFIRPLQRGPGEMNFNRAHPSGFVPVPEMTRPGQRLLLVDDTYTTGARLQSAHHALRTAGFSVTAAVVVTRKINPDARYGSDILWERQSAKMFDFTTCPWWATG